jgi:serine protease Do
MDSSHPDVGTAGAARNHHGAAASTCLRLLAAGTFLALLPPGRLPGDEAAGGKAAALESSTGDFRQIIEAAKTKVFPALIFVAPVVEAFESGKRETREQGGSGVVITADGFAITNWHVVEKAIAIRVLLYDGRVTTAEKIGEDKETDIALLKLKPVANAPEAPFPCAALGDSGTLSEGQFVMAMGAPWGLSRSVSLGILSCTTRYLPGQSEYSLWLQSDASINPGNSGGPLVDTAGQVVGINTLGTFVGGDMGFAVPSNTIRRIVEDLRGHREVRRSWTGIRLQPLNDFDRNTFFEGDHGVLVASVDEGSPALACGVQVGDLLLAVNGRETNGLHRESLPAINCLLGDLPLDQPANLRLRRGAEEKELSLTPRAKGKVEGDSFDCKAWNMTVKAINEFETPTLFFYQKVGVYVQGVRQPGNAAEAGLRRFDVIVTIDGKEVSTLDDIRRLYEGAMADGKRQKKVRLDVLRRDLRRPLVLDYSTSYKE